MTAEHPLIRAFSIDADAICAYAVQCLNSNAPGRWSAFIEAWGRYLVWVADGDTRRRVSDDLQARVEQDVAMRPKLSKWLNEVAERLVDRELHTADGLSSVRAFDAASWERHLHVGDATIARSREALWELVEPCLKLGRIVRLVDPYMAKLDNKALATLQRRLVDHTVEAWAGFSPDKRVDLPRTPEDVRQKLKGSGWTVVAVEKNSRFHDRFFAVGHPKSIDERPSLVLSIGRGMQAFFRDPPDTVVGRVDPSYFTTVCRALRRRES